MSRRSRQRREPRARGDRGREPERREPGLAAGRRDARGPLSSLARQLAFLAAVFALAVLVAELFGAANLGVALGVGQIAFAIALVYVLLRH
jgi:hypothetical protein